MLRHNMLVRIECALPNQLIRRATQEGIRIRRIVRIDHRTIALQCRDRDAHALLEMCRLYRIDARIIGNTEREPLRRHIQRRWTLLIGAALCATMMIAFLGRVWEIRICVDGVAPSAKDRRRILEQCAALDINPGTLIRDTDTKLLQKNIASALPDMKYTAAHLEGVRLYIEANTETSAPETFDRSAARDIVAARDGIILSVEADSGHACVEAGDAVRTGQTLILGEEAATREETTPVGASGRVMAKCWFEGEATGATDAEVRRRTGHVETLVSMLLLDYNIPLSGKSEFVQYEAEQKITPIGGLFLPIAMVSETRYETQTEIVQIDSETLRTRLSALAQSDARSRLAAAALSDAQIADYWENTRISDAGMHVHAVYEIITNIATTRDDLTKEVHAAWKAMNK